MVDRDDGWRDVAVSDVASPTIGGTPNRSVEDYWQGNIPWATAKDVAGSNSRYLGEVQESITELGLDRSSAKVMPKGTVVITARGTVGRLALLGIPMAMNQTCYGVRGASGYPDYFNYWNVRSAVSDLRARTHGTIFDTITRATFKIAENILPPVAVTQAFESAASPFMRRILGNLRESRALAAQRDALLPKLVSGEVRVV